MGAMALVGDMPVRCFPALSTIYEEASSGDKIPLCVGLEAEAQGLLWTMVAPIFHVFFQPELPLIFKSVAASSVCGLVGDSSLHVTFGTFPTSATIFIDAGQVGAISSAQFSAEIGAALDGLDAVIKALKEHRPLALSPDLRELVTCAAQSQGTPDDIETWSRKLAEDIGDLTD